MICALRFESSRAHERQHQDPVVDRMTSVESSRTTLEQPRLAVVGLLELRELLGPLPVPPRPEDRGGELVPERGDERDLVLGHALVRAADAQHPSASPPARRGTYTPVRRPAFVAASPQASASRRSSEIVAHHRMALMKRCDRRAPRVFRGCTMERSHPKFLPSPARRRSRRARCPRARSS